MAKSTVSAGGGLTDGPVPRHGGEGLVGMSQTNTMKVGWLDVACAGVRTSVILGPLDHLGEDHARAALRGLAHRGPSARFGLVPSSTSNIWRFACERTARVQTISALPVPEMLAAFEAIVADASTGADTLVIVFCGDYVALSADHGFGDATACFEMVAVATGADPEGYPRSLDDRPMVSALTHTLRSSPGATLKSLRAQALRTPVEPVSVRSYPVPDVRNVVMSYARSEPGVFNAIRKLRKESFPSVSMSAAVTYMIRRGFAENGMRLTDDLDVLVDLRRFLPEGKTTLANMPGIASFSASAPDTLDEYGEAYQEAVSTPASLLRMAAWLVKRRIVPAGQPDAGVLQHPDAVKTAFSDPSLHPALKKICWADRGDGFIFALINNPGVPHQIPITTMWDGQGRLHVTASYYSGSYDRAVLDRIIESVVQQPLRYLGAVDTT